MNSMMFSRKLKDKECPSKPAYIFFGDSLTAWSAGTRHGEGFVEVIEKRLVEAGTDAVVLNEGYPGYTTKTIMPAFTAILRYIETVGTPSPVLFTIFLGANDACLPMVSPSGKRFAFSSHVPLDEYANNIRTFISSIQSTPNASTTRILLITPPPINVEKATWPESLSGELEEMTDEAFFEQCKQGRGYQTWLSKFKYAQKILEIAKEYQEMASQKQDTCRVAVVDYWRDVTNYALRSEGRDPLPSGPISVEASERVPGSGLPGAEEFPEGVFTDRLHLGELGYRVLTKSITDVLDDKWPDILPP